MQRNEVSADFTHWLFDTRDDSAIFVTPAEEAVLAELGRLVTSAHSGSSLVRRLPGVLPQLLQSLRSDSFSGAALARMISHDVVLVAEVLRLASTATHGANTMTSIEHAVLVLGQNGLRQLISGVAFKPIIDLKSGHYTRRIAPRLWQQSEQCALACSLLAEQEGVVPFEAFLAGLIQYVGLIASLRVLEQVAEGDATLGSASFCNALIAHARVLSCSIATEWQFPPAIIVAIEEQGSKHDLMRMSPLGRILSSADYLSKACLLGRHQLLRPDAVSGLSEISLACLQQLRAADQPVEASCE
ncbi:MAG: HDOD domain-containing protein [Oxalobacteraceae bacterium]|nr:HDOD domain-containing protein [Oxalobacteraceae bacterium]